MIFQVRTTPDAEEDARLILEWLMAQEAGETGLRWFIRMKDAIASLAEMPERCKLAAENELFSFQVRELLYGRKPHIYRILFTIEEDTVVVLHLRHGRRRTLGRN